MNVLLVDESSAERAALARLVSQLFPQADVQLAGSVPAAHALLRAGGFQLVLLSLDASGGLAMLQRLRRERRLPPSVVVSGSAAASDALQALDAGAMGYVLKASDVETFGWALKLVLQGGTYLPPLRAGDLVSADCMDTSCVADADWDDPPLSARQQEVLELLARGLSNKLIARQLMINPEAVEERVASVLGALGVQSRLQAALCIAHRPRV